jgi:DNA recombination protein RmuC
MGTGALILLAGLVVGFLLGLFIGGLTFRGRMGEEDLEKDRQLSHCQLELAKLTQALALKEKECSDNRREAEGLREEARRLEVELASLRSQAESERRALEEKLELLEQARSRLAEAFEALSRKVLQDNSKLFFEMAREALEKYVEGARRVVEDRSREIDGVVSPLRESLEKVQVLLREIESDRKHEMGMLSEQLRSLASAQQELQRETGKLVLALKKPTVRGRWGEIQLRRVAELAGMVEHCDFLEQATTSTEEGRMRPDMIVHLPGGKNIIVDAKAPINAYLESLEAASEEERNAKLAEHAKQVKNRVSELGSKRYWDGWPSPDFAVLFLPGENFFSAALEKDPELIEYAAGQRVILATPTTLIALLRAVAYGWRQEAMAKSAQRVMELGQELYKRLQKFVSHFNNMRDGLTKAVTAFNDAVGSFETRVLVQARRFEELGVTAGEEIQGIGTVKTEVRSLKPLE